MSCQIVVAEQPSRALVALPDCGQPVVLAPVTQTVVVTQALQGFPGPPGEPGPAGGQALQRIAGQTISALLAVWEDAHSRVWPLDPSDEDHVFLLLGVTLTAADAGQPINVQRTGVIDDTGWSWTPGRRVFLGAAGALTHEAPQSGFFVLLGVAASPTRLILNIQDPIGL